MEFIHGRKKGREWQRKPKRRVAPKGPVEVTASWAGAEKYAS